MWKCENVKMGICGFFSLVCIEHQFKNRCTGNYSGQDNNIASLTNPHFHIFTFPHFHIFIFSYFHIFQLSPLNWLKTMLFQVIIGFAEMLVPEKSPVGGEG